MEFDINNDLVLLNSILHYSLAHVANISNADIEMEAVVKEL